MSHQIALGDPRYAAFDREVQKKKKRERSADGSGWQNISTDGQSGPAAPQTWGTRKGNSPAQFDSFPIKVILLTCLFFLQL